MLRFLLTLTLAVPALAQVTVVPTTLGAARVGNAYSTALWASGGSGNYTWTLETGTLPSGLSLSSGGVISGTPSATGTSNFTVRATNSQTGTRALAIQTYGSLSIPNGWIASFPPYSSGSDLATNGSFESDLTGWNQAGYGIDSMVSHGGTKSATTVFGGVTAIWQPLTITDPGIYVAKFWIKTASVAPGGSGVNLAIMQAGFNNPSISLTAVIGGTADWTQYTSQFSGLLSAGTYSVGVITTGTPTGQVWIDQIEVVRQYYPIQDFVKYPNYRNTIFSDQSQTAVWNVQVVPPNGTIGDYTRSCTITDNTTMMVISTQSATAVASVDLSFNFTGQDTGHTYTLACSLTGPGGPYTYPNQVIVFAAASNRANMTISFDANNRFRIFDQPKFLIGVYDSGLDYSNLEEVYYNQYIALRRLWELEGLNFYVNYWFGGLENLTYRPLLNLLQSYGVYSTNNANCVVTSPPVGYWFNTASDADVIARTANPGSAGFYLVDECVPELADDVFPLQVRAANLGPGQMNWGTLIGAGPHWNPSLDLQTTDYYPLFGPTGPYDFAGVNTATLANMAAVQSSRPVATVIEFFEFAGARYPTYQDLKNMSYATISEGANGVVYWEIGQGNGGLAHVCDGSTGPRSPAGSDQWCAYKVTQWTNLKQIVAELNAIQSPLSAIDDTTSLTGNTVSGVHTRVKTVGGITYLIASNTTSGTVNPTFTMSANPGTVTVYSEARTVSPSGAAFTDSFAAYEAHVYSMSLGAAITGGSVSSGKVTFSGSVVVR